MGILGKLKINKKDETEGRKVETKPVVKKEVVKKAETTSKTKVATKIVNTAKKSKGSKLYHKILLHPVVTEKSSAQEGNNKYSFIVSITANKGEIKRSIEEAYGVKPVNVRTLNMEGKKKRYGKFNGCRSAYKKAIVTMAKGKSINIHEGV